MPPFCGFAANLPPAGGIGVRGFPCKRAKCTFALCLPNAAPGGVGSAPPKRGLLSCGRWIMIRQAEPANSSKKKNHRSGPERRRLLRAGMLHIPPTCLSPHKGVYVSTLNVKKSEQGVLCDTLPGFIVPKSGFFSVLSVIPLEGHVARFWEAAPRLSRSDPRPKVWTHFQGHA